MAYPYISYVRKEYRSSGDEYLYDERVEPRNILHVTYICAYHGGLAADDKIEIGITDGMDRYKLDWKQMLDDPEIIGKKVDVHVPENRGIYAYFSTAAAGDDNELIVCGILYSIKEWQKKYGGSE